MPVSPAPKPAHHPGKPASMPIDRSQRGAAAAATESVVVSSPDRPAGLGRDSGCGGTAGHKSDEKVESKTGDNAGDNAGGNANGGLGGETGDSGSARSPQARRIFSLRWKALIALSLVLAIVNASLALLAYRELASQFTAQQQAVRASQSRQIQAQLDERYQQMSRLAALVPLLAPTPAPELAPTDSATPPPLPDMAVLAAHLQAAMAQGGLMLDLEWDVRSVHWIRPDGEQRLLWANDALPLPARLRERVLAVREQTARDLLCDQDHCRQYLAAPLLWQGQWAGALVLGGSLADVLLGFTNLSGAEVAVVMDAGHTGPTTGTAFPLMTHPQRTRMLFQRAAAGLTGDGSEREGPRLLRAGDDWFEVFRFTNLAPEINVLVMNQVTGQQQAIRRAIIASALLGVLGLLVSEGLLLLVMQRPLRRLPRLARLLPMLAEQRFAELDVGLSRLAPTRARLPDEIDLMVDTVGYLAERMQDLERDREEARTDLEWLADHDPLTHLLNRRRFNRDLSEVLHQARTGANVGALLFVDLDQFKDVNDISGHQMGDLLLRQVTRRLETAVADNGVLGRLGGDEFALLLPSCGAEQAVAMAHQLQEHIRSVELDTGHWRHKVSASIGIALFPEHGKEAEELMAHADLAMYQAKELGRSRWHLFSRQDEGRARANARVLWADRIADALAADRFELYLQPILSLRTGRIERAEALLRMRDPNGELVMPNSFIPIAEETGQIEAIDHWVLAQAIALQARQHERNLSMNLSANALRDPSLLPDIERLLATYGVAPNRLTFEVTETIAINSLTQATALMRRIQALGCRFALDDFGSGFASYAYLRQLPVDDVKIDGAFIRNLPNSREDRIFVRAVTEMAHGMGKLVTAEFVENEQIVEILKEIGVDYAQGYHIGRPAWQG